MLLESLFHLKLDVLIFVIVGLVYIFVLIVLLLAKGVLGNDCLSEDEPSKEVPGFVHDDLLFGLKVTVVV